MRGEREGEGREEDRKIRRRGDMGIEREGEDREMGRGSEEGKGKGKGKG